MIMMKKVLLPFLFLLYFGCYSQNETNKRPAFELNLSVNDSSVYSADISETKFVINDSIIQLFPNEKLYIELESSSGGEIRLIRKVQMENDKNTIVVEFKQIKEGNTHKSMQLSISNPFNNTLTYKAKICLLKNGKWVSTNVYPVKAKKSAIELWPDLITSISLSSFRIK